MFAEDIILKPLLTEKGYDGIADKIGRASCRERV